MNSGMIRRRCVSVSALVLATGLLVLPACNGDDDDDDSTTGTNGGTGAAEGALEDLGERADAMAEQAREVWRRSAEQISSRLTALEPEIAQVKEAAQRHADDAEVQESLAQLDEKVAAAKDQIRDMLANLDLASDENREKVTNLVNEARALLTRLRQRLSELGEDITQPPSLSGGGGAPGGTGAPIDD